MFSKCHTLYDGTVLFSPEDVTKLGTNHCHVFNNNVLPYKEEAVDTFVEYYRKTFPTATFIPKLHMMEDHVIPWIKNWKVGCGIMGEQGGESLHASFNYTEHAYNNMRDRVERLRVLLRNHLLKVLPTNTSLDYLEKGKGKLKRRMRDKIIIILTTKFNTITLSLQHAS